MDWGRSELVAVRGVERWGECLVRSDDRGRMVWAWEESRGTSEWSGEGWGLEGLVVVEGREMKDKEGLGAGYSTKQGLEN